MASTSTAVRRRSDRVAWRGGVERRVRPALRGCCSDRRRTASTGAAGGWRGRPGCGLPRNGLPHPRHRQHARRRTDRRHPARHRFGPPSSSPTSAPRAATSRSTTAGRATGASASPKGTRSVATPSTTSTSAASTPRTARSGAGAPAVRRRRRAHAALGRAARCAPSSRGWTQRFATLAGRELDPLWRAPGRPAPAAVIEQRARLRLRARGLGRRRIPRRRAALGVATRTRVCSSGRCATSATATS